MIMRDNGKVMIESEEDSEGMPDASDNDEVEYTIEGESLITKCALNAQIKVDDIEQ